MNVTLLTFALAAALPDRGIYPELSDRVSLVIPEGTSRERTWLRLDPVHGVITLYDGADPVKAWSGRAPIRGALFEAALDPDALAELRPRLGERPIVLLAPPDADEDRDRDGIVDRLDFVLGAKKLLLNRARYIERYVQIRYPGGDVPREEGVCTDTVIRALRNGGIDLQREVHEDIARAPRSYPMVEKVDSSINHRRVKTLLPWFERHWDTLPVGKRFLPGDVVFFDTFPSRAGPDHLGVVSDRLDGHGLPMVINNWTTGAVDAEMDLLSWVPVTPHFRSRGGPPRAQQRR